MKKTQLRLTTAQRKAALKRIRRLAGIFKGKGLMKSLMKDKKYEREL